jgi:hypothetical protein
VWCDVPIDEDVWHEEMGMCVDCSNDWYDHDDEEEVVA